jgi:hypothetical protein
VLFLCLLNLDTLKRGLKGEMTFHVSELQKSYEKARQIAGRNINIVGRKMFALQQIAQYEFCRD